MRVVRASLGVTMMIARRRESRGMWPSRIPTDEALLRGVSSRDGASFASLYDRHAKAVMSVAFRLVGDREIAADLTQATFLKLWERPSAVSAGEGMLRPWLLRVVRNAAVDTLRRRRLRAIGPDDRVVADDASRARVRSQRATSSPRSKARSDASSNSPILANSRRPKSQASSACRSAP